MAEAVGASGVPGHVDCYDESIGSGAVALRLGGFMGGWWWRICSSASLAMALAACGTSHPPDVNGSGNQGSSGGGTNCSHDGIPGCACSTAGAQAPCGRVESKTGDLVTCSMGFSECDGKTWGTCIGNQLVTKNVEVPLAVGGLKLDSVTMSCTDNLCDPYACTQTMNGPGDVDAGNVVKGGSGITLVLGEGGTSSTSCTGLQCAVPTCATGKTTSITGFVYDPAGLTPLYNILVYIPADPLGTLPALSTGATKDQCSGAAPVPTVAFTQTATDGSFTLSNIPSGTGIPAGTGIPIVVQTGEWRRELMLSNVTPCVNNTVTSTSCISTIPAASCSLRLPTSQTDGYNYADQKFDHGDMPQMAIVTGHYDPFECLLLKIGIAPTEFGSITNVNVSNSSSRRVHFFQSPDYPGTYLYKTYGDQVTGDKLWSSSPSILPNYDVVLLPCEGTAFDKMTNAKPMAAGAGTYPVGATTQGVPSTVKPPAAGVNPYQNMISYADAGGRIFATHFSYVWFEYPSLFGYVTGADNWSSVATWDHPWNSTSKIMDINVYPTQDPMTGTMITSGFAKGSAFAAWLQNVGASINGTTLQLHEARHDLTAVGANTQGWLSSSDTTSGVSPQGYDPSFTFNAPYSAATTAQYGRAVFSDFHVSEQALIAEGNGGGTTCTDNTDCGFTQTCNAVPKSPKVIGTCNEPCSSTQDCASSAYSCTGGVCKKTCTTNADCTGGELCINSSDKLCTTGACTCNGCYSTSNCFSNQGLAWCNGATTGSCTPAAPAAPSNVYLPQLPLGTSRSPTSLTGSGPTENNGWFPYACAAAPTLAQEQALEFMFFDLTGCVSPDVPPVTTTTPATYTPATFTQTFTASCPAGSSVRWTTFEWQATIPSTSSIQFAFQSGATTTTLLPASTPFPSVTATASTNVGDGGSFSQTILDSSNGGTTSGTGLLNTASPAVRSAAVLQVTITMNPTAADAGTSQTPTLTDWKAESDCVPAE